VICCRMHFPGASGLREHYEWRRGRGREYSFDIGLLDTIKEQGKPIRHQKSFRGGYDAIMRNLHQAQAL